MQVLYYFVLLLLLLALNREISTRETPVMRFTLPLFIRKHEMIVYAQSGMEFNREEKDRVEILQWDQFHTILV